MVLFHAGKFVRTLRTPGVHTLDTTLYETKVLSTKQSSYDIPTAKMVDKSGTPLLVSGVLVFQVVDSYKALVQVADYNAFIYQQAQSIS